MLDEQSIENLASAVFDKGRRGMPRPGCDCVQCFGYCLIDGDEAMRIIIMQRHDGIANRKVDVYDEVTK